MREDLSRSISPELNECIARKAEDHIKALYSGLNALQTDASNRDELQNVRRSAHTLKGAAGAVGLKVVTKLAHRMEDLLDLLYDAKDPVSAQHLTLLLNTTDRLHDLSFEDVDKEETVEHVIGLYDAYDNETQTGQAVVEIESNVRSAVVLADDGEFDAAPEPATSSRTSRPVAARQMLRVPIDRIDDVVRTVSELIINRTTFEQRMAEFVRTVDDLGSTLDRLRTVSDAMETRYSIDALGNAEFGMTPTRRRRADGLTDQGDDARNTEFDDLEFDRYNEFHLLNRSVCEITNDVGTVSNELRTLIGDFDSMLARQERLSRDTQDRLMRVRMVPLSTLTTRLHRAVRVVASSQQKRVELIIEGEQTELDKTVLEEIADPLLHLLRNAVDHGIEPAELRAVNGKPEMATIRIRAFHQGTQAVLRISDDGGGLDSSRIARAAIDKGCLSESDLINMTPQEIFPYIFVPGLSTAAELSEISGRGVGMDIVRDSVQKLKGTITVTSEPNQGTTFTIRLPLTLAVTRALMVVSGGQSLSIPMQSVVQIARLDRNEIEHFGADPVVRLDGTACPLIRLSEHLGLREVEATGTTIPILIIRSGDARVAVQVDEIVSGRDIVVKTLGSHLRNVPGLLGATLLGDGTVVPILDPNVLLGTENALLHGIPGDRSTGQGDSLTVMLVDDSVSVRRVMENLVRSQGWNPLVAKDGVDALEVLQATDQIPDIFLLDVEMPRMDGYELLSTLRANPQTSQIPIVMVTSRSGDKHRQKAFSLGASDYLVKPYQDETLIELVGTLTSRESSLA